MGAKDAATTCTSTCAAADFTTTVNGADATCCTAKKLGVCSTATDKDGKALACAATLQAAWGDSTQNTYSQDDTSTTTPKVVKAATRAPLCEAENAPRQMTLTWRAST